MDTAIFGGVELLCHSLLLKIAKYIVRNGTSNRDADGLSRVGAWNGLLVGISRGECFSALTIGPWY